MFGKLPGWDSTKKHIMLYGIASGMKYIHSLNILHRDLKPENILVDDYLFPKISDFGLSNELHSESENVSFKSKPGLKGTPLYMAPEIIKNQNFTKAGDVYSFAFMTYEIISGKKPYENMSFYTHFSMIISGRRPLFDFPILNSYKKLSEKCWSENVEDGPTFDEIVEFLKDESFHSIIKVDEFLDYVKYIDNNGNEKGINFKKVEFNLQAKKKFVDMLNISANVKKVDLGSSRKKTKLGMEVLQKFIESLKKYLKIFLQPKS